MVEQQNIPPKSKEYSKVFIQGTIYGSTQHNPKKTNQHVFKSMFTRRTICILAKINIAIMSIHEEPQQNEIGGPVTFALIVFAIVILAITFLV